MLALLVQIGKVKRLGKWVLLESTSEQKVHCFKACLSLVCYMKANHFWILIVACNEEWLPITFTNTVSWFERSSLWLVVQLRCHPLQLSASRNLVHLILFLQDRYWNIRVKKFVWCIHCCLHIKELFLHEKICRLAKFPRTHHPRSVHRQPQAPNKPNRPSRRSLTHIL